MIEREPADIPSFLAGRFFARLREFMPESVLDVGCGPGRLLQQCRDAGIQAHGVEPSDERVTSLTAEGLAASRAAAEALPFDDNSFDWVTMRHIAHHLADEKPALTEAFRVCRSGVLVAEPWLDLTIPSQRVARQLDAWIEEQSTRAGNVHRVPLAAGHFLAAVPDGVRVSSQLEHILVLRARPEGWLAGEAEPFRATMGTDGRDALAAIEAAAQKDGLSYNGTCILSMSIG